MPINIKKIDCCLLIRSKVVTADLNTNMFFLGQLMACYSSIIEEHFIVIRITYLKRLLEIVLRCVAYIYYHYSIFEHVFLFSFSSFIIIKKNTIPWQRDFFQFWDCSLWLFSSGVPLLPVWEWGDMVNPVSQSNISFLCI